MTYEIKHGDALTVLKAMPSESVQCAITSPPYYGLRSYKTEPQIWDGDEFCDHVWTDKIKPAANGLVNNVMQGETLDGNSGTRSPSIYSVCQLCNAWRGELGLEPRFQDYIRHLIQIFAEVKRVLKKDGVMFVNLGDSYAGTGSKGDWVDPKYPNGRNGQSVSITTKVEGIRGKSLMNIPGRFAIAMTDELQMIQRNELIWHKPACMPSSATDRWTVDFEPIYFFAKQPKYKFNQQFEPIKREWNENNHGPNNKWVTGVAAGSVLGRKEMPNSGISSTLPNPNGRNARTVRTVNFEPSGDEHYASYPTKLVEPLILAGTDVGDTVLDIFNGTATTGLTALRNRRAYIGIELNPDYIKISEKRLAEVQVNLF